MKPTQLRESLYSDAEWNDYWGLLAQLYLRLRAFQNLYQGLVAEVLGKTLGSIVGDKEKEHLQRILLGGYDAKNIKYSKRALGRFYRDILGIGVSDEQLAKFATRLREGDTPADAGQEIPIAVSETEVLKTLNGMTGVLQEILYVKSSVEVVEEPISYDVRDPHSALKALAEVLTHSRRLLPLYNPVTFIIQSFASTPVFYLQHVYGTKFRLVGDDYVEPEDEKLKRIFEERGIQLQILLSPDIANQEEKLKRAIIGHVEDSTGQLLLKLICLTYRLFHLLEDEPYFTNVTNEYYNYVRTYNAMLKSLIDVLKKRIGDLSTYFSTLCDRVFNIVCGYYKILEREVEIKGGNVSNVPYASFVEALAPLGFLGLAYYKPYSPTSGYLYVQNAV